MPRVGSSNISSFGFERQPFCKHDLLLVAAAQVCGICFGRGRLDAEHFAHLNGGSLSRPRLMRPAGRISRKCRKRDIFADRQVDDKAGDAAVFGYEIDAVFDRVAGRGDVNGSPSSEIFPDTARIDTEDRLCRFGAPGADEAGKTEISPLRISNELSACGIAACSQVSDLGEWLGFVRSVPVYRNRSISRPTISLTMLSWPISSTLERARVFTIAENDDAVGDLFDFAQPVRNVDDADTLAAEVVDDLKQTLRSRSASGSTSARP